jgi:beta-1,4-mannosyl-glycoprotein beta-1,4-N-acetylglucosaminyltransferase
MRKIYDCFLLFNELDLLEVRLNTLNDYVDYFVISEASVTHSGLPKEYNFENNKERFSKFLDKIIYIKNDDIPNDFMNLPEITNKETYVGKCVEKIHNLIIEQNNKLFDRNSQAHYGRDFFQKESVIKGLENCNDDDIIILSDLDEIPNPEVLKNIDTYLSKSTLFMFEQKTYNYYLNFYKDEKWYGSRMGLYKDVKDMSFNKIRSQQNYIIENGGWHFSFMGDPENVKTKIKSYSHQEFNNDYILNSVESNIENGIDPFFRGRLEMVDIDDTYPSYILNNLDNYKHMIK